jgi:hypothetical protein
MPTWRIVKWRGGGEDDDASSHDPLRMRDDVCAWHMAKRTSLKFWCSPKSSPFTIMLFSVMWSVLFPLASVVSGFSEIKFGISTQPHTVFRTVTVCRTFFLWTQYMWVPISSVGKCSFFFYFNMISLVGGRGWISAWSGMKARRSAILF